MCKGMLAIVDMVGTLLTSIDTNILKIVNATLAPVSVMLSLVLAKYSLRAFWISRNSKESSIGDMLIIIGIAFSAFSFISSVLYATSLLTNFGWGHVLSGIRSIVMQIMIIVASLLMIKIYRDKESK